MDPLVTFVICLVVVLLGVAAFFDYRRRNSRSLGVDPHTARHQAQPREGSEFREPGPSRGDPGGFGVG